MAQEIERKYLINKEKWLALDKPPGQHYRQGYISTDPKRTIRVRLTDTGAYLTIKGLNPGATRSEFEYEIPIDDAKEFDSVTNQHNQGDANHGGWVSEADFTARNRRRSTAKRRR